MSGRAVDVPEAVRRKAMARGAEGWRWLDRLGGLIREIERDWGVTVGPALGGGSESYVAGARTSAGGDAVVKVEMPPYASFASEVRTLIAAEGRGYVRLLEHDEEITAMLQERLGPSLRGFGLPVSSQIEILCATLRRAWGVPGACRFRLVCPPGPTRPAGSPSSSPRRGRRWTDRVLAR